MTTKQRIMLRLDPDIVEMLEQVAENESDYTIDDADLSRINGQLTRTALIEFAVRQTFAPSPATATIPPVPLN